LLERAAADESAAVVTADGGQCVSLHELLARGQAAAADLRKRGVRRGDRVGLIAENDFDFFRAFFGIIYAGAIAVPLAPVSALGGMQSYLAHVRRIVVDAQMRHIVGSRRVLHVLRRIASGGAEPLGVDLIEEDALPYAGVLLAEPAEGNSLAVIQYTSGSTTAPRGVMLTHRNIVIGLDAMQRASAVTAADVLGIWIPLFHDMGLFSGLSCLAKGGRLILWRPSSFVRKPGLWLREFSAQGCTLCAAPNFFYDYLAAEASGVRESLDLSKWRLAHNGAEPVNASTIEQFYHTFGECGFRREAMFPVYGMAEATLAVTFPELGTVPHILWVDRDRLTTAGHAQVARCGSLGARPLVSVGRPVPGISVRISDADRAEGMAGEIQITGLAVTAGYYRQPPCGLFTRDGWLRTGDLGFFRHRELYVTGRSKDVIKIRGASYFAEDAEAIVRDLPGVFRKRCAAVRVDGHGSESLALVVETNVESPHEQHSLTDLIKSEVSTGLGLPDVAVHLVPPRTLPQTSSGKIQRARVRASLCAGDVLQGAQERR